MPRINDASRACVRANGTPKKVYESFEEAKSMILKGGMKGKEPYVCHICSQIHVGRAERRMIFPTPDKPCGTPDCFRTDAHMPGKCGKNE